MKRMALALLTLVFFSVAVFAQKLTVSVMDLNVTVGLSGKEVVMLTDKLLNEFVTAGIYKVVERSKRDEILKELGFQQSGACDQGACLVEVGQLLGVQKMFGGTIGKLGSVFAVELRMIDVKTGEIDMSFSRQYSGDVSALLGAMKEAATEFSKWKPRPLVTAIQLKIEYGSIKIFSKPTGAKIMIDGSEVGETPAQLDKLESGVCQISLMKSGYQQYDTTVIVDKIKAASINATLSKITQIAVTIPTPNLSPVLIPGEEVSTGIGKEITNPTDGSVLIEIPAGSFTMGSNDGDDDEKPIHTVYLAKYYIGKYEVTVGQFRKYYNATGKSLPEQPSWNNRDDHPVVNVSWNDAKAYCDWAGLRLPTEAEWEKAARGTDGRKYPWGNSWNATKCNSSESGDGYAYTSPVGSFSSGVSPYGVYDMAGNAWEWCNDWYGDNYYNSTPNSNPTGPTTGASRVLRGGSGSVIADGCRSAYRGWRRPGRGDLGLGFRVSR